MTGIRSWTAAVTALGVVVRIEQVSTDLPVASFHRSHNPANANNCPSFTSKQNLAEADGSFAHRGMSPQRIRDSSRIGSLRFWRITGTGWVGATLKRGFHSGSSETAVSKYSSTICFLLDSL